jgi:hypothetical protein
MPFDHATEKLWKGIKALASGTGTIQERLYDGFHEFSGLREDRELPEKFQQSYREIVNEVSKIGTVLNTGRRQVSPTAMTEARASELAERILSMYFELEIDDRMAAMQRRGSV